MVHDSHAYRKMDVTRERISRILRAERNTLVNPNWFQVCQCCCCLCYRGAPKAPSVDLVAVPTSSRFSILQENEG